MRERLSVTIVCVDAQEKIRACLESVAWADEIVVCDSGSRDETLAICGQYTDRLYTDPWRGFGAHKNLALERAAHPWVLSLDADERVTPALERRIRRVLEGPAEADGYHIPRQNYFLGRWIRHGGWYPDYVLRLFRRDRGRFTERAVHEAVEVDGRTARLEEALEHHTYDSIAAYLARMNRYSALAAGEMRRAGVTFRARDLVWRPPATALKMYVVRQGFRDGVHGLALAGLYGAYTFAKYLKLWELEAKGGA
ncbi:MAG TPA: glycosyltransferase family 2 protein [Candidatus Methylomirabilis sp.]